MNYGKGSSIYTDELYISSENTYSDFVKINDKYNKNEFCLIL